MICRNCYYVSIALFYVKSVEFSFFIKICCSLTLGVVFLQLVIYLMFGEFSNRNIEISGVKAWIFLAFECLIVVALLFLIDGGIVQNWIGNVF